MPTLKKIFIKKGIFKRLFKKLQIFRYLKSMKHSLMMMNVSESHQDQRITFCYLF